MPLRPRPPPACSLLCLRRDDERPVCVVRWCWRVGCWRRPPGGCEEAGGSLCAYASHCVTTRPLFPRLAAPRALSYIFAPQFCLMRTWNPTNNYITDVFGGPWGRYCTPSAIASQGGVGASAAIKDIYSATVDSLGNVVAATANKNEIYVISLAVRGR